MNLFIKAITICLVGIVLTNCKTSKKAESISETAYALKKGSCFGRCPVYEIKVEKSGKAYLDAKMFNKENGKFERQLTKIEMESLKKVFAKANLASLKDEYPTEIQDLAVTVLSENNKSVKTYETINDAFDKAVTLMETIAKSEGWTMVEKYKDDNPRGEDMNIYDEIIIEPNVGVRLPAWFKEMEGYGVRLVKKISPDSNLWLITYDKNVIEPKIMLDMLKKDKAIKVAEFNKKISSRN